MLRKILFLSMSVVLLLSIGGITPAFAQDEVLPRDDSCISCHEDQYHLYDNGNWYCLCKTPVRCTDCHGGRTDTGIQELAHEGMVPQPLVGNAAVCQGCHPDDYLAHVEKFASIAGVSSTPSPCPTCTPSAPVSGQQDSQGGERLLRALPPGPWQLAGISFFGIAFLAVFLFACRCWKADQSYKLKRPEGE